MYVSAGPTLNTGESSAQETRSPVASQLHIFGSVRPVTEKPHVSASRLTELHVTWANSADKSQCVPCKSIIRLMQGRSIHCGHPPSGLSKHGSAFQKFKQWSGALQGRDLTAEVAGWCPVRMDCHRYRDRPTAASGNCGQQAFPIGTASGSRWRNHHSLR